MHYPSTPKDFKLFDTLKYLKHKRNILTAEGRSEIYWKRDKVVVEMADTYHVFTRSIFFNPEMTDTYRNNIERYTAYFTGIIRNIDVYLQKDQLMQTRCGFPLVPVPMYLPNVHKLGQSDVHHIEDTVYSEPDQ